MKCKESGTDPSLALQDNITSKDSSTKWSARNQRLVINVNLYNRDSIEKPNLFENQAVQVQDPLKKTWSPARVVGFGPTPCSYITEDESGVQLWRNRQLIKPDIQKTSGPTSPAIVKDNQSEKRNVEIPDRPEDRTRSGRTIKKPDRLMYK
jgi:hypothetical protein